MLKDKYRGINTLRKLLELVLLIFTTRKDMYDGRHIKQALSPHQGGGDMGLGAGGGEWYLRQC